MQYFTMISRIVIPIASLVLTVLAIRDMVKGLTHLKPFWKKGISKPETDNIASSIMSWAGSIVSFSLLSIYYVVKYNSFMYIVPIYGVVLFSIFALKRNRKIIQGLKT